MIPGIIVNLHGGVRRDTSNRGCRLYARVTADVCVIRRAGMEVGVRGERVPETSQPVPLIPSQPSLGKKVSSYDAALDSNSLFDHGMKIAWNGVTN